MKSVTRLHWLLVLSLFPTFLYSQIPAIQFKLQLLEADKWGVYAKPSVPIGNSAITGSGQVTLVMPLHYQWGSLASVNGIWINNTNAHGPAENPSKTYASFGWQAMDIPFQTNAETLLFTFKRIGSCPDSIYLIDAEFDPFNQLPNSINSNPGNELTIFLPGSLYYFESNYAPSAWSCHDNDSDGIPNALEDSNGNGVFDAGVDASDLNEGNTGMTPGCIKLKLQLLPDSSGWGVFAKPFDGYSPSENTIATDGRVTVVAPANMPLEGLESVTGQWSLTSTTLGLPSPPGNKFFTFEMLSNATPVDLSTATETMLFKFDKPGECPDFLRLLEGNISNSLSPNIFNGTDTNNFTSNGFEYCGVYDRKAWRCKSGGIWGGGGGIIIVTTDTLDAPEPGTTERSSDFSEGNHAEDQLKFTAFPNPAINFVNIVLSEKSAAETNSTITLWDLQGRKRQEKLVENAATQLDLSGLPAGVYLVSLSQNGRVAQREKLVLK